MESLKKGHKAEIITLCDVRKQIKTSKIKALYLLKANKEQSHE